MANRRRTPATEYFGAELRRTREEAGMSREELGKLTGYVSGTIAQLEIGERFPQPKFIAMLDEHFRTGRFSLIYNKLLRRDAYPESFRPWVDIEHEAQAIHWYELALIPGLLQIEAYARALFDGDEAKVVARLDRQAVLERDDPPQLVTLIHEFALRQAVGGREVMREQLRRLAAAADRHLIQVVPADAHTSLWLDGPFILAEVDGTDMVYLPTARGDGYILDRPSAVRDVRWRWDTIRAEALPRRQSKEMILEVAGD